MLYNQNVTTRRLVKGALNSIFPPIGKKGKLKVLPEESISSNINPKVVGMIMNGVIMKGIAKKD